MIKFLIGVTLFFKMPAVFSLVSQSSSGRRNMKDPSAVPTAIFLTLVLLLASLKQCHHLSEALETNERFLYFPYLQGIITKKSKLLSILRASGQILAQISSPQTWMMATLKPGDAQWGGIIVYWQSLPCALRACVLLFVSAWGATEAWKILGSTKWPPFKPK